MNFLKKNKNIKIQLNINELMILQDKINLLIHLDSNIKNKISKSNKQTILSNDYNNLNSIHSEQISINGNYENLIFELIGKNNV